jgi:hypothetical protein
VHEKANNDHINAYIDIYEYGNTHKCMPMYINKCINECIDALIFMFIYVNIYVNNNFRIHRLKFR